MFNAFGSPYETLHGPLGLYLWSFISCEYPWAGLRLALLSLPRFSAEESGLNSGCTGSKLAKASQAGRRVTLPHQKCEIMCFLN